MNAGHNPPLLLDHPSGTYEEVHCGGMLVGAFDGVGYESGSLVLSPGKRLVVYSDGVTEAQADEEEEYGEARLIERLGSLQASTSPSMVIEELFETLAEFTGDQPQLDDLTMLVLDQPEPAE